MSVRPHSRRPQRRTRRAVAAAVALGAVLPVFVAAGPASAQARSLPPWQTYRSSAFTDPAGNPCSFPVAAQPVRDGEQYRTLASYPNGDPKVQEFRGPLYFRYTNTDTGRSVVRNLSGYAVFRYGSDGSVDAFFAQNGGATVHTGNTGYPPGEWVFHGPFALHAGADGNQRILPLGASAENLCTTLG